MPVNDSGIGRLPAGPLGCLPFGARTGPEPTRFAPSCSRESETLPRSPWNWGRFAMLYAATQSAVTVSPSISSYRTARLKSATCVAVVQSIFPHIQPSRVTARTASSGRLSFSRTHSASSFSSDCLQRPESALRLGDRLVDQSNCKLLFLRVRAPLLRSARASAAANVVRRLGIDQPLVGISPQPPVECLAHFFRACRYAPGASFA